MINYLWICNNNNRDIPRNNVVEDRDIGKINKFFGYRLVFGSNPPVYSFEVRDFWRVRMGAIVEIGPGYPTRV